MRTTIMQTLAVCLLTAAAASAQGYSQPVREMETEARSAVRGHCHIQYSAGFSSLVAQADCNLFDLNQAIGLTVPQGKVLVVDDISAACNKATADRWAGLWLNGSSYDKFLPLDVQSTFASGYQFVVATTPARFFVRGGDKVTANINLVGTPSMTNVCNVRFAGHLVSVQ